jgi:hypothetical protein
MKNNKLNKFKGVVVLAIMLCSHSLFSQIQNPNWVLFTSTSTSSGTTNFHFQPNPVLVPNANESFYKNTPQLFKDENENAIFNYRGFNCYFDNDGFPVIYVINVNQKTYIFDKHGKRYRKKHQNNNSLLTYLKVANGTSFTDYDNNKEFIEVFDINNYVSLEPSKRLLNTSREISILKVGCNLLHVVVGEMVIEVDLTLKSWDYFLPYLPSSNNGYTSEFLTYSGIKSMEMGEGSNVWKESFHSIRRDPTNENKYTIYYLYSNPPFAGYGRPTYLNSLTIDAANYSAQYATAYFLQTSTLPEMFNSGSIQYISELEVSPNGSKIAIHDRSKILVYGINQAAKSINSFIGYFNFSSSNPNINFAISGMEFNGLSNKLLFNRYNSNSSTSVQVQDNVGILDLENIPTSLVLPNSYFAENAGSKLHSIITRGCLEMGRNGEIYAAGEFGLHKLNISTAFINDAPDLTIQGGGTINLTNDIFMGQSYAIRPLPEQQDGQIFISEGYHLDDEVFPTSNSSITFNAQSTSSGKLKIRGENLIYSNVDQSVIFENLAINPASQTKIIIKDLSELNIKNSNIETDACNKMWEGIVVENGGGLKIENTSSEIKHIKDAIVAVNYSGQNSGLIINKYTFERNAKAIQINNGGVIGSGSIFFRNIQITNCKFKNTEVLKDPSKGQPAYNLSSAGKGITCIEVLNTGSLAKKLAVENNSFEAGIFGIKAANSFISVLGCDFKDFSGLSSLSLSPRIKFNFASAIFTERIENGNNTIYQLDIGNNTLNSKASTFENNERHVTAYNGVSLIISNSIFKNSYRKGIDWVRNKKCSLIIENNRFLNCGTTAVFCDENAFPNIQQPNNRTFVGIVGNFFDNDKWNLYSNTLPAIHQFDGNAITINELSKSARSGYSAILVESNNIKNLRGGVFINGVTGEKNISLLTKPEIDPKLFDLKYNSISIRPKLSTLNPNGTHLINSSLFGCFENYPIRVEDDPKISNKGNGIFIENSPFISVKSNLVKAKNGLRGKMYNENSEILCNTFSYNRFAINLSDKHILRHYFQNHGIIGIESRSNHFIRSGISDIHRNNSVRDFRNGWVIQNNYMVKESCYKLGSTQNCFAGSNTIVNLVKGTGPDFCEGLFPPGIAPQVYTDTISDPIMKWEADFGKAVAEIKGNNNGTSNPKVSIINCIELVQQLRYQDALALVTSGFADSLDQKFANVLKSYINLYYPEPHFPNAQEELLFREVATLLPSENGSHVYLARSIMKRLFDEDFGELDSYFEDILINLLNTNCVNEINELELLFLNDQNQLVPIQYHIDSNYQIQIFGESLAELNPTKNFTLRLIHLNEDYMLTGTLNQLFQNQSSIYLNCSEQLGKKAGNSYNANLEPLSFYPNPTTEQIIFKGYSIDNPYCNIQLIDLTGRIVLQQNDWNGIKPLEIKSIATGVYIIQISNGEKESSLKLIKE